jgi:hypothetical protein
MAHLTLNCVPYHCPRAVYTGKTHQFIGKINSPVVLYVYYRKIRVKIEVVMIQARGI